MKGGALALKESREKELVAWINADPRASRSTATMLRRHGRPPQARGGEDPRTEQRPRRPVRRVVITSPRPSPSTALRTSGPSPTWNAKPGSRSETGFASKEGQNARSAPGPDARPRSAALGHDPRGRSAEGSAHRAARWSRGPQAGDVESGCGEAIDAYLDGLYGHQDGRSRFPHEPVRDVEDCGASDDAFMKLAIALHPVTEANREAMKNRPEPTCACVRATWRRSWPRRGLAAPDANSTLRVTYGQVKSVAAKDGIVWTPFTTLRGVVAKHTGEGEFNVPEREREGRQSPAGRKDDSLPGCRARDVPVNFLHRGPPAGTPGSPTPERRGELVGPSTAPTRRWLRTISSTPS